MLRQESRASCPAAENDAGRVEAARAFRPPRGILTDQVNLRPRNARMMKSRMTAPTKATIVLPTQPVYW